MLSLGIVPARAAAASRSRFCRAASAAMIAAVVLFASSLMLGAPPTALSAGMWDRCRRAHRFTLRPPRDRRMRGPLRETLKNSAALILDRGKSITWPFL